MRILAAGSKARPGACAATSQQGFTLIELLVVISIIAIASAGVAFAMRDSTQTQIEREAQRLSALLEAGRAQSRARGVAVVWRATGQGFVFDGLPTGTLPGNWLDSNTTVPAGSRLELGPEPIIPAQSVTLGSLLQSTARWQVGTDGLRPFGLRGADSSPFGKPDAVGEPP